MVASLLNASECFQLLSIDSLAKSLSLRASLSPIAAPVGIAAGGKLMFTDVCGNTGRSMGNHTIFLHQFGTIGESDRQFVIL